jgi:DNA-directed RNA polymerase specialized sigma24 family protein
MTPKIDIEHLNGSLEEQVGRLPEIEAQAFRMREVEGLEPAAICARLGIGDDRLAELLLSARVALCRALFS